MLAYYCDELVCEDSLCALNLTGQFSSWQLSCLCGIGDHHGLQLLHHQLTQCTEHLVKRNKYAIKRKI